MPAQQLPHTLDWSYAYTHRMDRITHENSVYSNNLQYISTRLANEISRGILPCLDLPFKARLKEDLSAITEHCKEFRHMIVLGIGGSALGARALQKAFFPAQDRPGHNGPWLWIADNIDADTFNAWMTSLPPKETVVAVISKSGGTIETMGQYILIRRWLQGALGDDWKKHVVIVTDEKDGELRAEATDLGLASLPVPDFLGGRYSVLSAVGLLPASFLGMDWKALLRGAAQVNLPLAEAARFDDNGVAMSRALAEHPAWKLAVWNRELMTHGYSELIFFSYIPLWNYFGAWFGQLWAESLGKDGKGSMPIPAVGVTDQHSVNQMFLDGPRNKACLFLTCPTLPKGPTFEGDLPEKWSYLAGHSFGDLLLAEGLGTRMALTQSQVPLAHFSLASSDEEAAGRFMGLCMAATILTGWLMDINPIDQPAVELGKRLANARLGASGYPEENTALKKFLAAEENKKNINMF